MLELPDPNKAFEYENGFYLSCDISRISKILAHYELYKMTLDIPGEIVECGVFKGASLVRFATFREILGSPCAKRIIAFDTFGKFPETHYTDDMPSRERFLDNAGDESVSKQQLAEVLKRKGIDRSVEFVEGDITATVPRYLEANPQLRISLLNLDTDIYEPAVTILEWLYPRIVSGGVLILDDYATFPGETKAVEGYFKGMGLRIRKFPFSATPCYVVKG